MKIDEGCINHNVVRIISELTTDIYANTKGDPAETAVNLAMILGEVSGVLDLANAMMEVLKA